jgi:uncharacterized protein YceH (UPF0502 family)
MNIAFSPVEVRLIGCLIEKKIARSEAYRPSRNALTNARNRKI